MHDGYFDALGYMQMPDEEAFCLLVRLMHSYDLRGHFLPEMPKLQLRLVRVKFVSCSALINFLFSILTPSSKYVACTKLICSSLILSTNLVRASDRGTSTSVTCALPQTRHQINHVLFAVVFDHVQLPVCLSFFCYST